MFPFCYNSVVAPGNSIVDDFEIDKSETSLVLSTAYRQSAAFGCTVHDLKKVADIAIDKKACDEIDRLCDEIRFILK